MYLAYHRRLTDFAKDDPSAIVGQLHQSVADDGFSRMWSDQTTAWREEVACLQATCTQLITATGKASAWTILLEYEIARRGRRIDAVLLTNAAIVVLEFKVGLQAADSSSRWQAYEYGLDLRDFHGGSRDHPIVPIVVPTGSTAACCEPPIVAGHFLSATPVHEVIECPPEQLAATILAVDACLTGSSLPPIDHDAWCAASYRPSLNIIEAAEKVFAGHEVREISHSTATNLSCTVDAVIRCITEAHRNRQRVVCFVTGVPGAGKPLAGLSAVHDPALRGDGRPSAVFLSGNGPLVKIVRTALVRDLRKRSPESRDGARKSQPLSRMSIHSSVTMPSKRRNKRRPSTSRFSTRHREPGTGSKWLSRKGVTRVKLRSCSKSWLDARIGPSLSRLLGLDRRSTKAKPGFRSGDGPFLERRRHGVCWLLRLCSMPQPARKRAACSPRVYHQQK
jgi:hypothetical protein